MNPFIPELGMLAGAGAPCVSVVVASSRNRTSSFEAPFWGASKARSLRYSEKFKAQVVRRMMGPNAASASALSKELRIPQPTLSKWLRDTVEGIRRAGRRLRLPIETAPTERDTPRAHALKETSKYLWGYRRTRDAERARKRWMGWAQSRRLAPMIAVARMVRAHRAGILNAAVSGVSNSVAEGLNSREQTLKQRACGFRNRERFKRAIYFHIGGPRPLPTLSSVTHTKAGSARRCLNDCSRISWPKHSPGNRKVLHRMTTPLEKLPELLDAAIRESCAALLRARNGETVKGYALCTDDGLSTLTCLAVTEEALVAASEPDILFVPTDWPYEPMREAFNAADALLRSQSEQASDLQGYVDAAFGLLVDALARARTAGVFSEGVYLVVQSTDPSEHLNALCDAAVERLNAPNFVESRRAYIKKWE